jgi:hypothetical protein
MEVSMSILFTVGIVLPTIASVLKIDDVRETDLATKHKHHTVHHRHA